MVKAITAQSGHYLTFDEFLDIYPEDGRYELVDGKLVRILATRHHDDVADFIADEMKGQVKQYGLNYKVSGRIVLATTSAQGNTHGRPPDVSVVDLEQWRSNRSAYTALREPIQLVVEVVSTNWEDDYIDKLDEYERLGIQEFWIVDYLALGSRVYLGNPKQPTVFVYSLASGGPGDVEKGTMYTMKKFQGGESIQSPTFSNLTLTTHGSLIFPKETVISYALDE